MTVTATPPAAAGDERLRTRAFDILKGSILESILSSSEPLRTVDAARLVANRLRLDLNEEELGGLASLVRTLLDSDPRYSQANRQWDLALRMGRAEGDRRKPVERAIEDFIDLLGHPAEAGPVAVLVSAVYGREAEYYEGMIERLAGTRPQFFRPTKTQVGITRWLLDLSSDDPDDVEYDNFEDTTVLEALRGVAKGVTADDAHSYAAEIVRRAGDPVDGRALLFLAWCKFPDTHPSEVFTKLYRDNSLALERGPAWVTADSRAEVLGMVRELARTPEQVMEMAAAAVPTEEEEVGVLGPTTVRVSDEDLDQVYEFMRGDERTYRVSELCQQALEAFPGSRTYAGVHASLLTRLRDDNRFQWVGFERFRQAGTLPTDYEVLPEGLAFDETEYLGEEGAEVDRTIDPREWKFNLDEQVTHYLVQDVGDDVTAVPSSSPTRLESSPPLHHYVAGTRYLRNADRGFFPVEPDLVHAPIVVSDGSRFDVWVNNRLGLIFGLKEWYDANLPWVGGKFILERGDQPDEFRISYNSGDVEPLMDIPMERLQQLLQIRAEAASESLPLTECVTRILRSAAEGLHFVTLFTEVNVVRRIRRTQLASVLSGQRYFTQTPNQPGIWHFDEKRASKPKKKGGPKRPMREFYDGDEDDLDVE